MVCAPLPNLRSSACLISRGSVRFLSGAGCVVFNFKLHSVLLSFLFTYKQYGVTKYKQKNTTMDNKKDRFATVASRLSFLMEKRGVTPSMLSKETEFTLQGISKWMSGSVFGLRGNSAKVLSEYFGCSREWMASGKGEPFPETDREEKVTRSGFNEGEKYAVEMMLNVIRSETIHREALLSNIKAFNQAVNQEMENVEMKEKIEKMHEQMNRQAEQMNRMEQLLLSIAGENTEKKRAGNDH